MIVYAGQKVFDRRLNNELGLDIDLLGDLVPQVDAKTGQYAFFFKDKRFNQSCSYHEVFLRHRRGDENQASKRRGVSKRMVPILVGWKER